MKIVYLILFAAGFLLPGCYTILEHPDVSSKDENGFVYHENVQFNDDCNSCHNSTDEAIVNTSPSVYNTYGSQRPQRMYHSDSYYSDSFYGDYGYYYNTPWWFEVSQSGSGNNQADAKEKYRGGARDNTGSARNESDGRESSRSSTKGSGLNYTSPTRSSSSGSSGSSSTTETTKSSNSGSSDSGSRSSSDQPASRNNDGGRSSGSGRR